MRDADWLGAPPLGVIGAEDESFGALTTGVNFGAKTDTTNKTDIHSKLRVLDQRNVADFGSLVSF